MPRREEVQAHGKRRIVTGISFRGARRFAIFLELCVCIKYLSLGDGVCGTGIMLTVAQERLDKIAAEDGKKGSIHLFGQELQAETYAIAKADMMLKDAR